MYVNVFWQNVHGWVGKKTSQDSYIFNIGANIKHDTDILDTLAARHIKSSQIGKFIEKP
jgi:hypothetical protein